MFALHKELIKIEAKTCRYRRHGCMTQNCKLSNTLICDSAAFFFFVYIIRAEWPKFNSKKTSLLKFNPIALRVAKTQ